MNVSGKVPGYPFAIFNCVSGWDSYYEPQASNKVPGYPFAIFDCA